MAMVKYRNLKTLIVTFLFIVISILTVSHEAYPANWDWDQNHDCVQGIPNKSGWCKWGYDGNPADCDAISIECCELLCKICPVYAYSGRYQKTFTDLTVPGVGPTLAITRTYNSQEWSSSLLGYSWTFNFGRKLIVTRNMHGEKIIGVLLKTGEKNYYREETDGALTRLTEYGATYELVKSGDNTYTIVNRDGTRYELRQDGKTDKVIDKNNNELVFTYNTVGCLSRITNASGNRVDFQLGPNGKIASVSDNLGRTIGYAYDQNGNLISVTDPLGNTTQYVYNSDNFLTQIIDARGNVVETAGYDNHEPPKVSTFTEKGETYTIAYFDGRTEKTDSQGNKWTYYFNDVGVIEKVVDPLGNETNRQLNKITAQSVDWEDDLNGNRTSYTYDGDGNIATKTDPLGNTWTYTYVAGTDLLEIETNPLGVVIKYEYDGNGNQTAIIRDFGGTLENRSSYAYDSQGNQTSVTDPLGNTSIYEYDANGNLIRVTDPLGNVTTYTYDSRGNRLTETDANGNTTIYAYDLLDRLASFADALGNTTTFTYDANGNLVTVTDANDSTSTYFHDTFNHLTQITDPLGNTIQYTYDTNGNRISMTDANGNTTSYTYNTLNQLTAETNALGNHTSYTYDGNGNLLTITDANGNTTTNAYDALNRLIQTTYPGSTFESFSYNADGNLIAKTDRNGNTINYTYDTLHRLTVKTYPDASTVNYTYDFNGNRLTAANSDVSYTFTYDGLNQMIQVTNVTLGKTVSYSYNCCGLKTSMSEPEGGVTTYIYDALGRLTILTNPFGETTTYAYNTLSRIVRKGLGNSTYTNYTYDAVSKLLSLVNKTSGDSVISSYSYTYDNLSNRTSMTTFAGTHNYSYDKIYQLLWATHPASATENYIYNPVHNRLTSTDHTDWTYDSNNRLISYDNLSYTYDANGNMTSKTETVSSDVANYQYDFENKLRRIDYPDGTYSEYRYDPFGNRIEKDNNGTISWFVYDLTKELPDVVAEYNGGGSLLASYTHGSGVDEIISMRKGGNSYFYLRDGLGSVTSLTDNAEAVVNTYEYDAFGKIVSKTETIVNPYVYTGRRLDSESLLIYYRNRYYDPEIGRFISADPIGIRGGINFYLYVSNNPINYVDPSGLWTLCGGFSGELKAGAGVNGTFYFCTDGDGDALIKLCIGGGLGAGVLVKFSEFDPLGDITLKGFALTGELAGSLDGAFGAGGEAGAGVSFDFAKFVWLTWKCRDIIGAAGASFSGGPSGAIIAGLGASIGAGVNGCLKFGW